MTTIRAADADADAAAAAFALCAEGAVLAESGDARGAIAMYARAVALAPGVLALHLILANALQLDGRILEAREALRLALRVGVRHDATEEFTLGKALVDVGAGADAVPCFRAVRAARPRDAAAAAALAAALRDAQRPDEAWIEISAALRLAPGDPVAMLTAAQVRHDLSDYAGALQWCERSLQRRPDSASARVTRGYLHHLLGDARAGWRDLEARALPVPTVPAPAWRGEPLDGRTLLVICEQGVGDQFQFLRFVHHPRVTAAARVIVSCQADAVRLLQAAGYDVVARNTPVACDVYVPLLSLPLLLDAGADCSGSSEPYITVPSGAAVSPAPAPRVGIVWAGNPAHRNDAVRSIPVALWHDLLHAHPGVQFVSLQHGVTGDAVPPGVTAAPACADWLDTAQTLAALDLLITVDTGIAHLAGAMGVPVWLLVSHVPDWRWGAHGSATAWYQAVRLFRQPARGAWRGALEAVSAALALEAPDAWSASHPIAIG